jgi:hypothetical protein
MNSPLEFSLLGKHAAVFGFRRFKATSGEQGGVGGILDQGVRRKTKLVMYGINSSAHAGVGGIGTAHFVK